MSCHGHTEKAHWRRWPGLDMRLKQYIRAVADIGPMQSKLVEQSLSAQPRIHWIKHPFQSTYVKLIQLLYLGSASAAANGVTLYLSTSTSFKTPIEAKCFSIPPEQMSALPALIPFVQRISQENYSPMSASSAFIMAARSEQLLVLVPLAPTFQTASERQRSEERNKEYALLDSSCQLRQSHELALTSAHAILIIVSAGVFRHLPD